MTTLARLIVLIIIAAAVVFTVRTLRPKLREQRHKRWEEAGLMPHQVDPYAPRDDHDDNPAE